MKPSRRAPGVPSMEPWIHARGYDRYMVERAVEHNAIKDCFATLHLTLTGTIFTELDGAAKLARAHPLHKDFIFREGDQASGMFVLEKGRVVVTKEWRDKQWVLRYLGLGDCFGEMALMDLLPRSASVQATEDCTAIEVRPSTCTTCSNVTAFGLTTF